MKQEAAEILSNYGGEIRENYSGRGMYGKETTGIVFEDEDDFFKAIADLLEEDLDDTNRKEVAAAIRKLQTDNMGKSIIYY